MTETGHKKEVSDATAAMVGAMSDHATALNSQATAMAASIAEPLYSKIGAVSTQITELAHIVANARQADLNWRTEERITRDAQSTRLYAELDKLIAASEETARGLGKLEARLDADEARLDAKRQRIEALESDVAALKTWVTGLPTPDESRRLIALLERLAAERSGDVTAD
jgi:hypothetical protein